MSSPQETQLECDLRQLVSGQPFAPDIEAIGQRARKRQRTIRAMRGAASAGAAVVVVGGIVTAIHGTGGTATGTAAARSPGAKSGTTAQAPKASSATLTSLAAYVTASSSAQPGDASIVVTTPYLGGTLMQTTYYLYTDSGEIYSANSESGLPAAVASHQNITGPFEASEIAAAKYAATGDLATARAKMAGILSPLEQQGVWQGERQKSWIKGIIQDKEKFEEKLKENPGVRENATAGQPAADVVGSSLWNASVDALTAGGGNPEVRAGVLRLLATVPGIKVANSTTGGKATLTLTAGSSVLGGSPEVLTIDAKTGSPVKFSAAAGGGMQAAVATYQVTRVTLSDVEKGKF